jgi:hypothetical protein
MDQRIFRDVALECLPSPDELDRFLKVTDSKLGSLHWPPLA